MVVNRAYVRVNSARRDFVERDERDTLPQVAVLQQIATDFLVLNDDVVEFATSDDLQSLSLVVVPFIKLDELSGESFDVSAVEAIVRVVVLEIEPAQRLPDAVSALHRVS